MKKVVKGLIIKDLYNLEKYKLSFLINFVVFACIIFLSPMLFNVFPTMIITYMIMIALSSFSFDEVSKSEKYILSLPITKKDVVLSKYILVNLLTTVALLFAIMLAIFINSIIKGNIQTIEIIVSGLSGYIALMAFACIQIPSIYKFGYEKGRINGVIITSIIGIVITGIIFFISKIPVVINNIYIIENLIEKTFFIILSIIYIVINYISYKVSCNFYNKREV